MKLFVTSNQQFGRPGAINAYKRPFKDVEEMNAHLIKQWNSVVEVGDAVFVLGNLIWDPESGEEIIKSLNGDILVIDGEWDRATEDLVNIKQKSNIAESKIRFIADGIKIMPNRKSVLSYWPLVDWPRKKKGYTSFIGHPNPKYKTDHKENVINVVCDRWDYKPIEINYLTELFNDPDLKK
jgi:calcineurin-like phosphoesterase family protein